MSVLHSPRSRKQRAPRPLDRPRLEELALAYVARFATSAAKLEAYLARKLRERGWDGEGEPDPSAIVARFVEFGYIDDASFARAKAGGLLRRGYGPRRVAQALGAAGIDETVRQGVRSEESEERRAALALARKRRFGPFGPQEPDRAAHAKRREKQIAAMLRAGHPFDSARAVVDAQTVEEAENWAEAVERGES